MDTRETLQGLVADRYEIVRELGHGGAAVVYLALDLRLGAHVALKILHQEFSGSQFATRFAQEIRLMADFHHAHILPVLDSGEWIGRPFYVMSYVEGETLEARLARERRLPLDDVLELARGITSALAYAHAHSVVHRDVKPSNILLSEGHAYLSDFGIAKALKPLPGQHRTTTGTVVGTRAYMSPEQGSHDAELDGRSDLYSLGCVLFEALAGQHPFHSADESRMWAMRFTNAPDSLRRHRESVPARVDAAIMRALARDPADRWQSAREFAEALGVLTLTSEVGIVRISSWRHFVSGSTRGLRAAAIAAVLLLGVGAIAVARQWTPGSVASILRWGAPTCAASDQTDGSLRVMLVRSSSLPSRSLSLGETVRAVAEQWKDVIVEERGDADALAESDACAMMRAGASRVIAYESVPARDRVSWTVRSFYPGEDRPVVRTFGMSGDSSAAGIRHVASSILREVLRFPHQSSAQMYALATTERYAAWDKYASGRDALEAGAVSRAESLLTMATREDPRFSVARQWLALVRSWSELSGSPDGIGPPIPSVASPDDSVPPLESAYLAAMSRLARGDYPASCTAWAEAARLSPTSAVAHLGEGECRRLDDIVETPAASPLYFRASYAVALEHYRQALSLCREEMCAVIFARIERVVPDMAQMRIGRRADNGQAVAALQEFGGGRLEHRPLPMGDIQRAARGAVPATLGDALAWARARRVDLAGLWLQREPNSAQAHAAMSRALETRGMLVSASAGGASALHENTLALQYERRERERYWLVLDRARLLLRASLFDSASALADSLLAAMRADAEGVPATRALAGLAIAVGRTRESAAILAAASALQPATDDEPALPGELLAPASEVRVLAAIGVCGDTLDALERQLTRLLEMRVPGNMRRAAARSAMAQPLSLSAACHGFSAALRADSANTPLLALQQMAAGGKFDAVRRRLDDLRAQRTAVAASDVSIDQALQESLLRMAAGDSALAIRGLSEALDGVSSNSGFRLEELGQCAALARGRVSLMRWQRGDSAAPAVSRISGELDALWKHADVIARELVRG